MAETPAPRLELRWRKPTHDEWFNSHIGASLACDYGLVLPVDKSDIRSNERDGDGCEIIGAMTEVFYVFGTSLRGGDSAPLPGDAPYRDGAHAKWDAEKLGGLPIFVCDLDGNRTPLER